MNHALKVYFSGVLDFPRPLAVALRLQLPVEVPQFRLEVSLVRSGRSRVGARRSCNEQDESPGGAETGDR